MVKWNGPFRSDLSNRKKLVHLERWADLLETFPVGPNRSIQFNPRSLESLCIEGTDQFTQVTDSSDPLMHHDPSDLRSLILIQIIPKERTLFHVKFMTLVVLFASVSIPGSLLFLKEGEGESLGARLHSPCQLCLQWIRT